jgi:DNA-binding NarL/FixJ family response regulator
MGIQLFSEVNGWELMFDVIVFARYATTRAGLVAILENAEDVSVVADTGSFDLVPELVEQHAPDALLVDLVDEPPEAALLLHELAGGGMLPLSVLIHASATDALDWLALPRASHLLRDATPVEILAALHTAPGGLVSLDERVVQLIGEQFAIRPDMPLPEPQVRLSAREQEVMWGVSRGLPNKSIARELGISEHTVKFHIGSIFQKLNVSSRSEPIVAAVRSGMLDLHL